MIRYKRLKEENKRDNLPKRGATGGASESNGCHRKGFDDFESFELESDYRSLMRLNRTLKDILYDDLY